MKGAKYSTHHSTFGCPYSLQNLNKDSCLVDRLSNNSMTEESDWSYASKQKLAVVKAIKGNELLETAFVRQLQKFSRANWPIFIVNKRTDTRVYNLCDASTRDSGQMGVVKRTI